MTVTFAERAGKTAMRHGDFILYEFQAITRYIDRAFDGPELRPAEPRAAALAPTPRARTNATDG